MSLAVSSRYASALVDVVMNPKAELSPEVVLEQLRSIESAIAESRDLRTILESPAVAVDRKIAIMSRLCDAAGMQSLVRNFVFVVVRKRRGGMFSQILVAFERLMDERLGVQQAEIRSALPMSDGSRAHLEAELARITGKRIRPRYSEDSSLLGGAIAKVGTVVYDGSVRGQLDVIEKQLKAG